MERIKIQTPEGMFEYAFCRDGTEYEACKASGEIAAGMEIVYRGFVVAVQDDFSMLIIGGIPQIIMGVNV